MQCSLVVPSVKRKGKWHWVAGLNVERRKNRKAAIKTFLIMFSALGFVDADRKPQHVCGRRWETETLRILGLVL